MLFVYKTDKYIDFTFSSGPVYIALFLRNFVKHMTTYNNFDLDRIKVCLIELIKNAVLHGNKNNVKKFIKCKVNRKSDSLLEISVNDQGQGFDWNTFLTSTMENGTEIARSGFPLVLYLADSLTFNKKGNKATVEISFEKNRPENYCQPQQVHMIHSIAV